MNSGTAEERNAAGASADAAFSAGIAAATDGDDDEQDEVEAWEPQERFFRRPLDKAGSEFHEVTLDNLARFFRNPCRYLLRERLGIVLPQGDEVLQDDEPFVPDMRARRALSERMLPRLLDGESLAELRNFARAGIEYPAGRLGDLELEDELQRLERFARLLVPVLTEPKFELVSTSLEFGIDGEPWRLTGGFGDLRKGGRVRYRYDDVRANDYLDGWTSTCS